MRGLTDQEREFLTTVGTVVGDDVVGELQARGLIRCWGTFGSVRAWQTTAQGVAVVRLDAAARALPGVLC